MKNLGLKILSLLFSILIGLPLVFLLAIAYLYFDYIGEFRD